MDGELKNILIIFNPAAGVRYPKNYQAKTLQRFKKLLPQTSCCWLATQPDLKTQLAGVGLKNYDRLIIIGGDGTVKQVAEFILRHNLEIPLAVIPQGSANVLANSLNIPLAENQAIKVAAMGKEQTIDVGLVNQEHYFLVGLSIGLLSEVVLKTKQNIKTRWGIFAYLITLLKQTKAPSCLFNFQIDSQNYQAWGNTLLVTNTFSLFKIKPRHFSDYTDGLLEVMVTRNKSIWGFFPIVIFSWLNRLFLPNLFLAQGQRITIEKDSLADKVIQMDGEPFKVNKIEATIVPRRLKVVTKSI